MEKYFDIVLSSPLFAGVAPEELGPLLECLGARARTAQKDEVLLLAGEPVERVGLVLAGSALVAREDRAGNRNILAELAPGELYGEALACAGVSSSPVTVNAREKCAVLEVGFGKIISPCSAVCAFHSRLIRNLLRILAQKNLVLNDKVGCLGHRTTREKVLAFLELQRQRAGANPFEIPFSRAAMADYLCVERSALSAVLSRMREDGEIDFDKNRFTLL